MGVNLHENCHDWRGVTASLLYQISTQYLKPFINYSGIVVNTYIRTLAKNHISRRFRPYSEYSDTNISNFFSRKHSFRSEEAKKVKWFRTFTVYSTSIREALKLKKNDTYSICSFIFNNKWRSVGNRTGQTSTEESMLQSSITKNFLRQVFSPIHGEYFCKIFIRSVDK